MTNDPRKDSSMARRRVTRRRFIQAVGGGTAAGIVGLDCLESTAATANVDNPLFRFVQWNDMHVDVSRPPGYKLANEKCKHLVDSLNAETYFPTCDFVVAVGDMVNGDNLPSVIEDLKRFEELTADLKCPLYPVVGNHENVQQEGNATYEAPYRKTFGENRMNYTFQHRGVLFVMLNDSGAPTVNRREAGQRRYRWLAGVLDESKHLPKILCCHIPLVPLRDEPILKKSFHWRSYIAHDDQLLKVVNAHADSIIAVLSGHLHLTGAVQRNGIWHIVPSGTASYPCDFAAYEVFADRIRVRMCRLPDDLLTRDTDIHGKACWLHEIDYTDAAHRTHESYIMGNLAEREFEIALVGKKRLRGTRHADRKLEK